MKKIDFLKQKNDTLKQKNDILKQRNDILKLEYVFKIGIYWLKFYKNNTLIHTIEIFSPNIQQKIKYDIDELFFFFGVNNIEKQFIFETF